jgi:four helix bundle protein
VNQNSIAYDKAYQFAIRIVRAFHFLTKDKREFILSKQLLRSGTAIWANLAEANGAISNADFSNKISIAYKECLETKYWLSLLKDTDFFEVNTFESIYSDADEIAKILYSILKTTQIKEQRN